MQQINYLHDFAESCWKDVFTKIKDAAVYIDHAAAECLHWFTGDVGYLTLKEHGAISVHELSLFNFQYVRAKGVEKAVVISTSIEPSFYRKTLRIILEKNNFSRCIIICAVHSSVLDYNSILPLNDDDTSKSDELKQHILVWNNDEYEAQIEQISLAIKYTPIFTASLNENIFVTPPFAYFTPSINDKLFLENENDINFFVSSIHTFFKTLNLNQDIYSMGRLSDFVADKLTNLPAFVNRRKNLSEGGNVSLILLDRSLDLSTACTHNTESLLGRILCTLPHLHHHNNDVAINMSPLCPGEEECLSSFMIPGCLATNNKCLLDLLLGKKQKDLLLTFNKMLIEICSANEINPGKTTKLATRVSAHSLEKLIHKIRDSESIESLAKYSKILQIIIASIQALKSDKTAQLELIMNLEKLVLQNLSVCQNTSSIVAQLSNVIKSRTKRGLDMENLLVLLIYVYSLAGDEINFLEQQEQQLKNAIAEVVFEDMKKCNEMASASEEISVYYQTLILLGVTDEEDIKRVSQQVANQIMDLLHVIAKQRQTLENYKSIISKPSVHEIATSVGLLEKLLNDLLDPNKPEIPDLHCKTRSLLSTGFSLLMKNRSKHPSDNQLIIIYIIGGITADEGRILQEKLSLRKSTEPRIILAGSRLLNPVDVLDDIFLNNINVTLD